MIAPDDPFPRRRIDVLDSHMTTIDIDGECGEPIVFLHGNPTHAYLWRNVIPHIRGRGRIVAPDLIGMGGSGKPAIAYRFCDHARYLAAFLDVLALDRVTFVTHDWGTALALNWWLRNRGRVRRLVISEGILAAVPSWEHFPPAGRSTFQAFRTPGVGERMILDENHFIEQSLPRAILRGLTASELAVYRAPFARRDDRFPLLAWPRELPIAGEPADMVALVECCQDALTRSEMPKLLLTVEPGALIKAPLVEWCRANLPALEIISLGAGIHYPQEDQPDAFGAALANWLARSPE
jgi:haloalkane dehalogenase